MHDVVISGIGQTSVGEHWDISLRELAFYAIEKAQTVSDTKKIVKVMESIDFSKWDGGLTGPIGMTGKEAYGVNHQAIQMIAVGKVVNGKEKVVAVLGKQ